MRWWPTTVGVYVTVHVAVSAVAPGARVQPGDGVKFPVELVVKLTVPVGVVGDEDVSVTVAVQFVAVPACIEAGEQSTVVLVGWGGGGGTEVASRLKLPELDEWVESPESDLVIWVCPTGGW